MVTKKERPHKMSESSAANKPWWLLPLLLFLVLSGLLVLRTLQTAPQNRPWQDQSNEAEPKMPSSGRSVTLEIDFGSHPFERRSMDVAWHEGMTVASLLAQAKTGRSEPGFTFSQQGTGAGAFLTAIEEVPNEGATGQNWQYRVNGQSANKGFAIWELRPGDRVLWKRSAAE